MNVQIVRRLALDHSIDRINDAIVSFEKNRSNILSCEGADDGEVMSNLLAAQFVRHRLDNGMDVNGALREYGQRVKSILGKKPGSGGAFGGGANR